MKLNSLSTSLIFASICSSAFAAEEWKDLFNGKDLSGWVQRGGKATYAVQDGAIVGTSVMKTPNSFLCTDKDYSNFILEYEFKVDPRLNSGVQIRTNAPATPTEYLWKGRKITVPADRVHGYQIEIDIDPKKDRWWVGGIFDESRRDWLAPMKNDAAAGKAFTNQGRSLYKKDQWNKIRVEAIGGTIKTFLNGKPRAELKDSLTPSGFIGLQVHNIDKVELEGTQARWRNIRIQEVEEPAPNTLTANEKAEGWKLLWDGKTNEGWRSAKKPEFPTGGWTMENGELTIRESGGGESTDAGDIITKEKFSEFELSVDFKITPGANSGIKIFVDPEINKGEGSAIGPEFQILDDEKHPDAKAGLNGCRTIGSLYDMITAPPTKTVFPPGSWNNARIVAKGKNLTYYLNGVKTIDIERGSQQWREHVAISKYTKWNKKGEEFGELPGGHILLQDHGNKAHFRNIKIRNLSKK